MVALLAVVVGLLVVGLLEDALGAAGQRLLARAVSRAAGSRRPEVRAFLARIGDLSAGWRLMGVTGLGVVASIGAVLAFDRGLVAKGVSVAVALTTGLFLLTLMISVLWSHRVAYGGIGRSPRRQKESRLWGFRRQLYRDFSLRFSVRSRAFRNTDSNRAASAEPTTSESTVAELQSAPVIRSR